MKLRLSDPTSTRFISDILTFLSEMTKFSTSGNNQSHISSSKALLENNKKKRIVHMYGDIFNFIPSINFVILDREVKGFVVAFSRSGVFGNDEMVD